MTKCCEAIRKYEKGGQFDYVLCQWQTTTKPSGKYLAYRWLIFIGFIGFCSIGIAMPRGADEFEVMFLFAFTHWGYALSIVQSLIGGIIVSLFYQQRDQRLEAPSNKTLFWWKSFAFLNTTALEVSFIITIAYWTFLYDYSKGFPAMIDITVHVINGVLMFIDLWMVRHPIEQIHFLGTIIFIVVYFIVVTPYFFLTPVKTDNRTYVERHWNFGIKSYQDRALVTVFFGGFLIVSIHFGFWGLSILRRHIYKRTMGINEDDSMDKRTE